MTDTPAVPAWWSSHSWRIAAAVVAAVAIAASFTGIWNGFTYDDVMLIPSNPAVKDLRWPWAYFTESYWGPPTGNEALYRPVVVMVWSWLWALGGGAPWIYHALNTALYATACLGLLSLLRQLFAAGPALVGACVFAAHPVHVEAVANVVGQSELLVATVLLGTLALYAHDRRQGALRRRTAVAIVIAAAIGLLTKEHAIVLPALLVMVEWAGQRLRFAATPHPWRDLWRLLLAIGLVTALYLAWRNQLLGAVTGDSPHWAVKGRTFGERASIMLALVPELLRLLVFPVHLYADYAPQLVPILPTLEARHIPGALIVVAALVATFLAWRRGAPVLPLALAWFVVTYLPTSNLLFPVGVVLAERTLFIPSVVVALLVAALATAAVDWVRPARTAAIALVAAGLVFGTLHSAVRSRVWEDNATLFSTLAVEAPTNFRGVMALADYHAQGGRWPTADSLYQVAMRLYPEHVPARLAYVKELQIQGEFERALVLARSALRDDPDASLGTMAEMISLLHAQRFSEARSVGLDATARGWGSTLLDEFRRKADSMLAVTDSADARNRFVREGLTYDAWTGPLTVRVTRESLDERRADARRARAASHSATDGGVGGSATPD